MAAVAAALPPGPRQAAATPTVYLAGDSTMAEQGGKNGTEGEGKERSRLQRLESCITDLFFFLSTDRLGPLFAILALRSCSQQGICRP